MSRWVTVARAGELESGGHLTAEIDGELVAVFHIDGKYYAVQDVCTHDGGLLTGGELHGTVITCPRHGAQFDITTGAVLRMPAVEPVSTYEVRVEGDDVQVLLTFE